MTKKIGVVILTYNRISLLKICVSKVLNQTYSDTEILIVDNNSEDGTKDYLKSLEGIDKLYLSENLGPAGGFYEGIKHFAENTNVDYVWLMDDDFFPHKSCLDELVMNTNEETMVFPYVREKDFASRRSPGWWGVLIPLRIVETVGYPRADLFFWSEDTEYLQARIIQKYKYQQKWISSAKGVHFTVRETNYRKPWRYYYEIRNSIYSRLYIKEITFLRIYKLFRTWFKLLFNILLKENGKAQKLKWFFKGTFDGIFKNLGKRKELHNLQTLNTKTKLRNLN
ncbi:glycosyltransferase family 2 protein [Christiangramia sp. LLG6405-1]|uniref:glycosyltransferase family 2 protein n=1 Tax=Christiangramia sp. LLG6405-1 TaxID=3160832 RepID=UPI003868DA65